MWYKEYNIIFMIMSTGLCVLMYQHKDVLIYKFYWMSFSSQSCQIMN
jgi:hypothetical protein